MFGFFGLAINNHYMLRSFGFTQESHFVSLMIFMKCYSLISFLTGILSVYLRRQIEFEADAYAAKEMKLEKPLATALIKMHRDNKSNLNPDWLYAAVHFNHPTLQERLNAIGY